MTKYNHINPIKMQDIDTKTLLSIGIIFGTSDFAKLKM